MGDIDSDTDIEGEEAHKSNLDVIKEEAKYQEKLVRKQEKINQFRRKMQAASLAKQILIWIEYRWKSALLLQAAVVATGSLLGVTGKILWEIWKTIFTVQL